MCVCVWSCGTWAFVIGCCIVIKTNNYIIWLLFWSKVRVHLHKSYIAPQINKMDWIHVGFWAGFNRTQGWARFGPHASKRKHYVKNGVHMQPSPLKKSAQLKNESSKNELAVGKAVANFCLLSLILFRSFRQLVEKSI